MCAKQAKPESKDILSKIPSGIPGFDLITLGGIPKNRATLVSGTAGSTKTVFAVQFLYKGITELNEPGVFVTCEETIEDITRNVLSFNWDLNALRSQKKLAFVDLSPSHQDAATFETGGYDFSALFARIEEAVRQVKAKRVCVDSIGTLFSQFNDSQLVRREIYQLTSRLKALGVTSIITAERLHEYGNITRYAVEDFVADNVVILRNIIDNEKRRRTIEILKLRGTAHQKGEYPFTITHEGMEVLPLSAIELAHASSMERIATGNIILDQMTGGGYFRNSIILCSGPTGTGKTLNVLTFLTAGLESGEKTLLFAFEESKEQFFRNATAWNIHLGTWEKKKLLIVDCAYPEVQSIEDHLLYMKKVIKKYQPKRIAVDSLSALERICSIKAFREFVLGLTAYIKSTQAAGFLTTTTDSLMGPISVTEMSISTITDTILLLRYVEIFGQMHRGITILKMRGSWHDKSIREYQIDTNGMHIGNTFENVSGILSGAIQQVSQKEVERFNTLFSFTDKHKNDEG